MQDETEKPFEPDTKPDKLKNATAVGGGEKAAASQKSPEDDEKPEQDETPEDKKLPD